MEKWRANIIGILGAKGQQWLDSLPNLITYCEEKYQLKLCPPMPNLSFNYVAKATKLDGHEVIVKICIPGNEFHCEMAALKWMQGDGIIQLIAADMQNNILILEACQPGKILASLNDDNQAVTIAAGLMQHIDKPIDEPSSFPTTKDWFTKLDQLSTLPSQFPKIYVDQARQVAAELHQDATQQVLLHGDLHHFNILQAQRQPWLVIDPKGVIGEPAYEIGAFLRNPIPNIATTMDTTTVMANRVDQFTDILGYDRHKIIAWGFAQAVLAAVWSVDGNSDDWQVFLSCANVLSDLIRHS